MPELAARDHVLARFRWVHGHADIWRLFGDQTAFDAIVTELADLVRTAKATKVAGIESRGFIIGGAVALRAGLPFVPIRKEAGLLPGAKITARSEPDYRGSQQVLRVQREVMQAGDRVMLVDDWAEVGSQAAAPRELIEGCGAYWAGVTLIVDQLGTPRRAALRPVSAIVTADELGPPA